MTFIHPLTVFDVETTGLDATKGHKIVEIAGLRIENGVIDETKTFISYVNPERDIPWETKQIHKISDEDVAGAPTIDQVLPAFLEFATGTTLVAHNAAFDMGFLRKEKDLCWGFVDLPDCICTMRLSQVLFPQEFRHNLDIVASRLGLPKSEVRHRALPDVILTAQALLKMLHGSSIDSLEDLKRYAGVGIGVR